MLCHWPVQAASIKPLTIASCSSTSQPAPCCPANSSLHMPTVKLPPSKQHAFQELLTRSTASKHIQATSTLLPISATHAKSPLKPQARRAQSAKNTPCRHAQHQTAHEHPLTSTQQQQSKLLPAQTNRSALTVRASTPLIPAILLSPKPRPSNQTPHSTKQQQHNCNLIRPLHSSYPCAIPLLLVHRAPRLSSTSISLQQLKFPMLTSPKFLADLPHLHYRCPISRSRPQPASVHHPHIHEIPTNINDFIYLHKIAKNHIYPIAQPVRPSSGHQPPLHTSGQSTHQTPISCCARRGQRRRL